MSSLEKALELRMNAHEVHTSNIANANVPNFKAKKVEFDARMQAALEILDQESPLIQKEGAAKQNLGQVKAEVFEDPLAPINGDGNSVNMEKEQTEIAKNTIGYNAAIQMINKKFALAKYILGEGGR